MVVRYQEICAGRVQIRSSSRPAIPDKGPASDFTPSHPIPLLSTLSVCLTIPISSSVRSFSPAKPLFANAAAPSGPIPHDSTDLLAISRYS